jgi:hypothetical protein
MHLLTQHQKWILVENQTLVPKAKKVKSRVRQKDNLRSN